MEVVLGEGQRDRAIERERFSTEPAAVSFPVTGHGPGTVTNGIEARLSGQGREKWVPNATWRGRAGKNGSPTRHGGSGAGKMGPQRDMAGQGREKWVPNATWRLRGGKNGSPTRHGGAGPGKMGPQRDMAGQGGSLKGQ